MTAWLSDPQIWASLITLTALEIVLGIDNIVFISVITSKLQGRAAASARKIGIAAALGMRLLLLFTLTWLIGLSQPVIEPFGHPLSWRDLILIAGGLFLLFKATHEIHNALDIEAGRRDTKEKPSYWYVVGQIMIIDTVFSVDSIVTAIGIAEHIEVMVVAIVIAMVVMYSASEAISNFIQSQPTTKMLALSFLILIGAALIADGIGFHIPRGYIYFSMGFATAVEAINVIAAARRKRKRNKQISQQD